VVGATSSAMLECGKKACLIPPTVSEMPVCGHNPGSAYFVPYYGDRLYEAECVYPMLHHAKAIPLNRRWTPSLLLQMLR